MTARRWCASVAGTIALFAGLGFELARQRYLARGGAAFAAAITASAAAAGMLLFDVVTPRLLRAPRSASPSGDGIAAAPRQESPSTASGSSIGWDGSARPQKSSGRADSGGEVRRRRGSRQRRRRSTGTRLLFWTPASSLPRHRPSHLRALPRARSTLLDRPGCSRLFKRRSGEGLAAGVGERSVERARVRHVSDVGLAAHGSGSSRPHCGLATRCRFLSAAAGACGTSIPPDALLLERLPPTRRGGSGCGSVLFAAAGWWRRGPGPRRYGSARRPSRTAGPRRRWIAMAIPVAQLIAALWADELQRPAQLHRLARPPAMLLLTAYPPDAAAAIVGPCSCRGDGSRVGALRLAVSLGSPRTADTVDTLGQLAMLSRPRPAGPTCRAAR
jgi:hypothetical protein